MNIISASLVSRLADLLDFTSAVDVTIQKKSHELTQRQVRMMEDQFDLLFKRYERICPIDVDTKELNARAAKELARRKISTAREMERRAMRAVKRQEREQMQAQGAFA